MPRKIKDESGSYDAFDFTPPDGLKEVDIIEIAKEFEISDAHEFVVQFQFWAAVYRNNQAGFRNTATLAQRRESAKHIAKACGNLIDTLEETGAMTIDHLRTLNQEHVLSGFSENEYSDLHNLGAFAAKDVRGGLTHNIDELFLWLRLLRFESDALAVHMETIRESVEFNADIFSMDRRVLMDNIRQFTVQVLEETFERDFIDDFEDGVEDVLRIRTPRSRCCRFVVRCAQAIDPSLSVDMIEHAMRDNISNAGKTPS